MRFSASAIGATVAAPYWFTSQRANAQPTSANDRVVWGALGTGDRWGSMRSNRRISGVGGSALKYGDFAALADVDAYRRERACYILDGIPDRYEDYQHILDRKDIDAVTIVTPDHWHSKMAIEAMQAGKDVYCEKPLTLTIDEGKQICKVAEETGRVFQVGTQQRSEFGLMFLRAVAIAHSGRLGKIQKVTTAIGSGPTCDAIPVTEPPKYLNWDKWLGQTEPVDFRYQPAGDWFGNSRCHYEFRWWYEYSGGKLTDWGAHHIDIAQWAMGMDHTGPMSVEPLSVEFPVPYENGYPTRDDMYNTPVKFTVRCKYPDDMELVIRDEAEDMGFGNGIMIEGTEGRILVNRDKLVGKPVEDLEDNPLPEDALTKVYKGKEPGDHMGNFVECMRTREQPISDVFTHHRTMTTCHLANIALRLNRKLEWDAEAEQIRGDDQANTFLSREQRKGYEINV
jgi:predicted dehydrogenase